jgi:hypothetical protein
MIHIMPVKLVIVHGKSIFWEFMSKNGDRSRTEGWGLTVVAVGCVHPSILNSALLDLRSNGGDKA